MQKRALAIVLMFVTPFLVNAQSAIIDDLSGRVEVRPMGGNWGAALVGNTLSGGDTISTGFNSSATLTVGGSTVTITPLTRLTLEELVQRGDTQETRLFLQVGKVRADVRTAEGLNHDFRLRSASTTASVRGTSFEFDGVSVRGYTGEVQVSNLAGHGRRVIRGETVTAEGVSPPVPAERERERRSSVRPLGTAAIVVEEPETDIIEVPDRIDAAGVVDVLSETLDLTTGTIDIGVNWELE